MSVSYYPLFTQTVGAGGASSITFNNIPQGYQDLRIEFSLRSNAATGAADGNLIIINNSSYPNSIYSWTQTYATGSGVGGNNYVTGSYIGVVTAATATTNTFTSGSVDIPAYTSGVYKSAFVDSTSENGSGSPYTGHFISNSFRTTSPITSLSILCGNGSFVQYSTVTLYVRAAQYQTALPVAPTSPIITDQAGFASVSFTPSSSDNATAYAVTDNNLVTTYGASSPIIAPATLGSATTYTVKAVNALGSASATTTPSLTSTNSFVALATYVISSTTSSVFFTNIPQNYKQLQIRAFLRMASGGYGPSIYCYYNGDNGNNYSNEIFAGNGSSITTTGYANTSAYVYGAGGSATGLANTMTAVIFDIYDYANTAKYKTTSAIGGWDYNGSGYVWLNNTAWYSLAPITNITLSQDGSFAQFSHIALYGMA